LYTDIYLIFGKFEGGSFITVNKVFVTVLHVFSVSLFTIGNSFNFLELYKHNMLHGHPNPDYQYLYQKYKSKYKAQLLKQTHQQVAYHGGSSMRNARAKLAHKLSTAQSSVANTLISAKAHASKSKDDIAEGLAWFKKSTKLLRKADTQSSKGERVSPRIQRQLNDILLSVKVKVDYLRTVVPSASIVFNFLGLIGVMVIQLLALVGMGVSVMAFPTLLLIMGPIVAIVTVLIGCFSAGKTKVSNNQMLSKIIGKIRSPVHPSDIHNPESMLFGMFRSSTGDQITFHSRQEVVDFLASTDTDGFYNIIIFDERECHRPG